MIYQTDADPETVSLLKERIDQADAVSRMKETEGWKIVEKLFADQLAAYVADNATEAKDWSDYLKKAGKIHGIKLLMVDVDDFIRQGVEAANQIDEFEKLKKVEV
jgi:hypothetical protein